MLLFQTFNSRTCQLILGAGALQLVGLKTITTKNLGTETLQLLVRMIVCHISTIFGFDSFSTGVALLAADCSLSSCNPLALRSEVVGKTKKPAQTR